MTLSREMELVARDLYSQKSIRGFLHVYVGQVRGMLVAIGVHDGEPCPHLTGGMQHWYGVRLD